MKNIVAKRSLIKFYANEVHKDSEQALKSWYEELVKAEWRNHNELKKQYGSASIISDKRVVFNIAGNKYRLVVDIEYKIQFVFIIWIGTHKEYDKLNISEISFKNK